MDNLYDADWNNNKLSLNMRDMVTVEQAIYWSLDNTAKKLWQNRKNVVLKVEEDYIENCF